MTGKLKAKPPSRRDAADAARLQKAGTHGDTVLAHINPAEARLLDALADGLLDGGGRNPKTGLLSFGMSDGESGRGDDSNPGGVGGGPAGGQTGGGIGGNTEGGQGGLGGGYGDNGYAGSANQRAAQALGDYYQDTYIGGLLDDPYAPKDTWQRVLQEYMTPSRPAPGRFAPPTKDTPGLFGGFLNQVTPSLMGMPAFGIAMGIGGAMGRASSPATQEASAAEMGERGAQNSGGNQGSHDLNAIDAALAKRAGTASGAATAELPQIPPGYTRNPAGQLIPLPGSNDREAWKDPVQNTLLDFILNGRRKGGFGW